MRGLIASSIGVTCAAVLALPPTSPATAATTRPAPTAEAATRAIAPTTAAALPGSTQSLPLTPLGRDRGLGAAPADQGLSRRAVPRFSLLGVVWNDPDAELDGRVQVRTRAAGADAWSGWQEVETDNADHGADPDTPERTSGHVRGATAPLWVGDSDGVEVRVHPDTRSRAEETGRGPRTATATAELPTGLRLELIDPGTAPTEPAAPAGAAAPAAPAALAVPAVPAPVPAVIGRGHTTSRAATTAVPPAGSGTSPATETGTTEAGATEAGNAEAGAAEAGGSEAAATEAGAANADLVPADALEIPALTRDRTRAELLARSGSGPQKSPRVKPYIGPRPKIVTRKGWGADESLRETGFRYTTTVKVAFVHHTATGNAYKCSEAASVIRGIYRYHVKSLGWRDIGYNFLVDKCGGIYEGRAGGVDKAVLGAHTLGFNTNSTGIAVLGTFNSTKPSSATVKAIAQLTAWKLGLFGANPKGTTYLKSGGGNLYPKGKNVRLNVISGHKDGFATECPGKQLYGKLGTARSTAATYQGR